MRWLQSLFTPLKKMWVRLNSAHKKSTFISHSPSLQFFLHSNYFLLKNKFSGRGIYILYEDIKSCPYEDVHVMWSILVESSTPKE
ncbi:hypothetical protein C5167_017306 [Papaver somniferum]|uniref:Uncharacterized protein n=1 Tax=Papaver somniferum TaxID=3469 RepID=A0A4Y7IM66_PAPSO|nr:hypothetical protein C5167_017306 [Papaver somniferum]